MSAEACGVLSGRRGSKAAILLDDISRAYTVSLLYCTIPPPPLNEPPCIRNDVGATVHYCSFIPAPDEPRPHL